MSEQLLQDRGKTHGNFAAQASCAQRLKAFIAEQPNWKGMDFVQRESLDSIALKISRILHGDPTELDHWHDIAGYANLGAGWKP